MSTVKDEGIFKPERFAATPNLSKEYIKQEIDFCLKKIDENMLVFRDTYPAPASVNNVYPATPNVEWTPGFWTGMLWLAYDVTGDEKYREHAEYQLQSYKDRLDEGIHIHTHDLGFLYTLSCVAAHRLTGNQFAKDVAIQAADLLLNRYLEKAGIIQAWGNLDNPAQRGRMIIDCCLNLPLLYWAYEQTGMEKYNEAAKNHIANAAKYLIREDSSTFHTYYMDPETGEPKFGKTSQGYSDDSAWARGQAWGIYGLPLNYIYNKNDELIDLSKKLTNYFLNRLPEDFVCYWDLIFTDGDEERDSSAASTAVCGMLELIKSMDDADPLKATYKNAAELILKSLADNYTSKNAPESNGLLLHAVYGKPLGNGIDECCIWGDYFYLEALVRMYKDWELYW